MFAKPENWSQLSPLEKRKLRLDDWEKSDQAMDKTWRDRICHRHPLRHDAQPG